MPVEGRSDDTMSGMSRCAEPCAGSPADVQPASLDDLVHLVARGDARPSSCCTTGSPARCSA